MGKCKSKLVISTTFMIVSLFSSIGISFAWWFTNNNIISNVTGNTPPSYFAFGDGSEESPYGITSPVHLYNLAWLQYLGTFNNPTDQKQYHFVLDKDIDMKGLTLPPIGTTDNPFIGTFDGGNHLISNLTVSNKLGEDDISKYPSGITSLTGVDIVGMFGVIGNYNNAVNYAYNNQIINIHDLFLDKTTIVSSANNSLMGILAGYMEEGNMSNVDIHQGKIQAESNVKPLSGQSSISNYSILGDFNADIIDWVDKPQDTETPDDSGGWGDSVDFYTLSRRINYMYTEGDTLTSHTTTQHESKSSTYNSVIFTSESKTSHSYDTNADVFNLLTNTYIPLNIDKETMIDNATESTKNIAGTSQTSKTNSFYSSRQPEIVSPTNTGYIVGGGTAGKNNYGMYDSLGATLRTKSVQHGFLNVSYGASSTNQSFTPSDPTNVDIVTMVEKSDNSGACEIQIISDQYNQGKTNSYITGTRVPVENYIFHNYDNVREELNTLLNQSLLYGMRFYKSGGTYELSTSNSISGNVSINGKQYSNYQLLNTSIMFNVSSGGYLTLVAAGIQSTSRTTNYSLFNLYKISRNKSTNQITGITKIDNIYKTTDGQVLYNQSSRPANSKLIFNSTWLAKILLGARLIYLELPLFSDVYPAEFALGGCVETGAQSNGAYIMYLDLGASGDVGAPPTEDEGEGFEIQAIKFVDEITSDRTHKELISIVFKLTKDQTTTLVNVYFKRDYNELMFYYVDPSSGLTITAMANLGVVAESNNTITF